MIGAEWWIWVINPSIVFAVAGGGGLITAKLIARASRRRVKPENYQDRLSAYRAYQTGNMSYELTIRRPSDLRTTINETGTRQADLR